MNIVGVCRFSLVGRGDWKEFQGKAPEEINTIARNRAKLLFTPERMDARLKTFEHLTLASIRSQTDQNFRFIVLASKLMPDEYKDRLKALCDDVPQVVLRFFPITAVHHAQHHVFRELGLKYSDTLQFRLDDDDCVCANFIALMRERAVERMSTDDIFVASIRGVMYSSTGGNQSGVYNWPVDFMSAGAAIRHPSKSIYQFGHFNMGKRFPAVIIEGGMALVTHNGTNDTSFTPAFIRRRGMIAMKPEEVNTAIRDHFPFLTNDGKRIAGLSKPERPEAERPASRWLDDLLTTRHRRGFFISSNEFGLQHTFRSRNVLYVGFDNLASVRSPSRHRDPWGYEIAERSEWSGLGVLCYKPNWFRIPELFDEMQRLRDNGFFDQFAKVVWAGTSMGAYAACAFSSLAPGSTVIAFSPQATLDPEIASWDKRYPTGSAADWTGPFANCAESLKSAGKAWVVYDPHVSEDNRHAEMLSGDSVTLLRARHASHFTAQYLAQVGILGKFVRNCVLDDMSEAQFYSLYRAGRSYRRYLTGFVNQISSHPSLDRRRKVAAMLRAINKPGLANDLERTIIANQPTADLTHVRGLQRRA